MLTEARSWSGSRSESGTSIIVDDKNDYRRRPTAAASDRVTANDRGAARNDGGSEDGFLGGGRLALSASGEAGANPFQIPYPDGKPCWEPVSQGGLSLISHVLTTAKGHLTLFAPLIVSYPPLDLNNALKGLLRPF